MEDVNRLLTPGVKRIFKELISQTRTCMKNTSNGSFEDDLKCETAYLSDHNGYTYHTHPNGNESPSEVDRRTTQRLGKQYLIIGMVPTNKIVVYSKDDGFKKMITSFYV